jgi:hypothetical protein
VIEVAAQHARATARTAGSLLQRALRALRSTGRRVVESVDWGTPRQRHGTLVWALYTVAIPLNAAYLGIHLTRATTWPISSESAVRLLAFVLSLWDVAYFRTALFLPQVIWPVIALLAVEPSAGVGSGLWTLFWALAVHEFDFFKQEDQTPYSVLRHAPVVPGP